MIYNLNLGIGWASSGVEYAQLYRARVFRSMGVKAKFFFMDMFPKENIQQLTENIGFYDAEVEWLYTFFTDTKIAPVTFTLKQLEATFPTDRFTFSREKMKAKYVFTDQDVYYLVHLVDEESDLVHRVEMVADKKVVRKDYYTYCRVFTEYYAPLEGKAHLYQRRFYNEDGSVCYEEIIDGESVLYRFPDRLLYSKEELIGYMISRLQLTADDVLIIDRSTTIAQAALQNAGDARIISIIHAEHFNEGRTYEDTIQWNNYYEYIFSQHQRVSCYVTATQAQRDLLLSQLEKYKNATPKAAAIPVGSLMKLVYPNEPRRKHSLITASRLAKEKNVDWIIKAVVKAKKEIPDLTLDIYGKGTQEDALRALICENHATNYIRLCGQQKLDEVYVKYDAYISGSMAEGFGLTLLEAVGSGLPIVGFDARYGNQTFIDDGENGYRMPAKKSDPEEDKVEQLYRGIVRLFSEADLEAFHEHSYQKAEPFLMENVKKKWEEVLQ